MANVSQQTPTFLGGVSRKADFDKTVGQVVEANNIYPDETYGMVKRPGTEFIGNLGIDNTEAADTYFFPIIREGRPRYLCGLSDGSVKVWDLDEPSRAITVNVEGSAASYLTYNNINNIVKSQAYRAASDDRRTVIINRTVECQEDTTRWSDEPVGFEWTPRGHKRTVNSVEDLPQGEVIKVNWGEGGESVTQPIPLRPGTHYLPTTIDEYKLIDNGTEQRLQPQNASGCVLKCQIDFNGAIVFLGAYRVDAEGNEYFAEYGDGVGWVDQEGDVQTYDAEVWASGSNYPDQLQLSIDGVEGARCTTATGLLPGYVHRVVQSGADNDDIYFQAFGNFDKNEVPPPGDEPANRALIAGPYVWKECPSPDSYIGLDASTLPHELIDNQDGTFTFQQVDYSNRWAGDNKNNPAPSFIGSYINNVFFLNNRLGFLSEDNVILSRPINYGPPGVQPNQDIVPDDNPWVQRNYYEIDFFRQSGVGMNDADPIDMKAANNNTSIFHTVIATPQGVILFADGQQSLLYQPEGLLSPLSASINSLSNYDMTGDINAVIVGETYYFINKSEKFCKIYSMVNQGMQNPPVIEDVTKEVADWLPNDITDLVECPTDSMIFAFNRTRDTVYCRRTIGRGSSWVKWTHAAPVIHLVVDHDLIYFITNTADTETTISKARLYVLPDDYSLNQRRQLEPPESEGFQTRTVETRTYTTGFTNLDVNLVQSWKLLWDYTENKGGSYFCESGDLFSEEDYRPDQSVEDDYTGIARVVFSFFPKTFLSNAVCHDGGDDFNNVVETVGLSYTVYDDTYDGTTFTQAFYEGDFNNSLGFPNVTYATDEVTNLRLEITAAEFPDDPGPEPPLPPVLTNDVLIFDPYLDHFTDKATVVGNVITPPTGYPKLEGVEPCYVLGTLPGEEPVFTDRSGQTGTLTWEGDTLICDRDLTGYEDVLLIGYRYNYQLIVPNFYVSREDGSFDYTASLTVSRTKFALGFSGTADFEILTKNAPNPTKAYTQILSNDYVADTAPLGEPTVVSVPIHKRNTDFRIQISSDSPFPLSVDSCMWEGNYSPRYYRRI